MYKTCQCMYASFNKSTQLEHLIYMAIVWAHGSTILLASCSSPQSSRDILALRWDCFNDSFILDSRIPSPAAGDDAELLAGGWVLDSESGLFQSYLVFRKNLSLLIGCLDPNDESFEIVAELSLSRSNGSSNNVETVFRDCWLANGPTFFAVWNGQLIVATPRCPASMSKTVSATEISCLERKDYIWEANLLALSDGNRQQFMKVHFCGEIRKDRHLQVILSIAATNSQEPVETTEFERCLLCLSEFCGASYQTFSQAVDDNHGVMKMPFKLAVSEHSPAELEPNIVSCIQAVAATPCSADVPHDLLIGTRDRRLLRCRHGLVIDVVHLEAVPTEIHFALVAGGQGVIVIVLSDTEPNVLAICAESHQKLQDWSKIRLVVVGDFSLSGHDQIVLLRSSTNSNSEHSPSLGWDDLEFTTIHGFNSIPSASSCQGSQQHLREVKAIDDHQVSSLNTISKALEKRIETGLMELKAVEHERESKRELYEISSRVMQAIVASHVLESTTAAETVVGPGKAVNWQQLEVVRATSVKDRVCGITWFLFVDVEIVKARSSTTLHQVSLLVTSLNGCMGGRSSVLESLASEDGSRSLVVSIPLQTLGLLPGFPYHIVLKAAKVSTSKRSGDPESLGVNQRYKRAYTQWLYSSQLMHPASLQSLCAEEACMFVERAIGQQLVVVGAQSKGMLLELVDKIRSALFSEDLFAETREQSAENVTLMSMTGLGIAHANVCCVGTHAIITLKTSNTQLMAILRQSILLILRHEFQLHPTMLNHEIVKKVSLLADALVEELRLTDSLDQTLVGSKDSRHQEKSSSRLRRLQMTTDRSCSEVLSLLS